jgi:hypothetical protein
VSSRLRIRYSFQLIWLLVLIVSGCSALQQQGALMPVPQDTQQSVSSATATGKTQNGSSTAAIPSATATSKTQNSSAAAITIAPISSSLHCSTTATNLQPTSFVVSDGAQFTFQGQPLKLRGYTFYPGGAGGTAAWRKAQFTQYIDHILDMGAQAGQNLVRITDYWDSTNTSQSADDAIIWHNIDYAVCAAKQRGMFVIMDISAFKKLLISQGKDPMNVDFWKPFIATVAHHYQDENAVAFYSIVGEPAPPTTPAESQTLVAFYRALTDEFYADDPHHLITAGGFIHMENETPQMPWWHEIYALPHNDVASFKTYSQHDLNLMPTIAAYAHSIHKVLLNEEFGMPQQIGDAVFSGGAGYNGIVVSRAKFFDEVYTEGETLGVAGMVFWNMGCQLASSSFQVNPQTPATWQTVIAHSATAPSPGYSPCP